jgi:hypothetical protein
MKAHELRTWFARHGMTEAFISEAIKLVRIMADEDDYRATLAEARIVLELWSQEI